jgi:serine/threonine-protein kinase RsbW
MEDRFYLELPLKKEYFTTIRLATGGICSQAGFDIDDIEDFKLCVSEACLLLMRNDYCKAFVEFKINGGLTAVISGGDCKKINNMNDEIAENFSFSLLNELVSEVEFIKQDNIIKQIKLVLIR